MNERTLIVAFFAAVIVLATHIQLDHLLKIDDLQHRQATYLPKLETVQLLSGGFDKLIADIYWLGFIQYSGVIYKEKEAYTHCYDYVNLVTGLDPKFTKPYWFGCWSIGYWQGRPDLADKILKRGIEANPDAWDLAYLAGINQYLFCKDDGRAARAAKYYMLASTKPGAPDFLVTQAKILDSDIPKLQKEAATDENLYYHTDDPNMKDNAYKQSMAIFKEMIRTAPTPLIAQETRGRIGRISANYEKYLNGDSLPRGQ